MAEGFIEISPKAESGSQRWNQYWQGRIAWHPHQNPEIAFDGRARRESVRAKERRHLLLPLCSTESLFRIIFSIFFSDTTFAQIPPRDFYRILDLNKRHSIRVPETRHKYDYFLFMASIIMCIAINYSYAPYLRTLISLPQSECRAGGRG